MPSLDHLQSRSRHEVVRRLFHDYLIVVKNYTITLPLVDELGHKVDIGLASVDLALSISIRRRRCIKLPLFDGIRCASPLVMISGPSSRVELIPPMHPYRFMVAYRQSLAGAHTEELLHGCLLTITGRCSHRGASSSFQLATDNPMTRSLQCLLYLLHFK